MKRELAPQGVHEGPVQSDGGAAGPRDLEPGLHGGQLDVGRVEGGGQAAQVLEREARAGAARGRGRRSCRGGRDFPGRRAGDREGFLLVLLGLGLGLGLLVGRRREVVARLG